MVGKSALVPVGVMVASIGLGPGAVVQGQGPTPRVAPQVRVLDMFGGQGGWIGASVRDAGDAEAQSAKLPSVSGVVVEEVTADSPAQAAGLKSGDLVVELDGERVRSTRQFSRLVQETPPGRKVAAVLMRGGQRVSVTIEPRARDGARYVTGLEELSDMARSWARPAVPPVPPVPPAPPTPPSPPRDVFEFEGLLGRGTGRLGLTVSELQPQLADYFGTKTGVLVTSVAAESASAKAGLKAGDVITSLNGAAVGSAAELRQRSSRLSDGAELTIEIVRDRKTMTLKGKADTTPARRRTVLL